MARADPTATSATPRRTRPVRTPSRRASGWPSWPPCRPCPPGSGRYSSSATCSSWSAAETATVLGCSVAAVNSALHRARTRMRETHHRSGVESMPGSSIEDRGRPPHARRLRPRPGRRADVDDTSRTLREDVRLADAAHPLLVLGTGRRRHRVRRSGPAARRGTLFEPAHLNASRRSPSSGPARMAATSRSRTSWSGWTRRASGPSTCSPTSDAPPGRCTRRRDATAQSGRRGRLEQ